MPVPRLLSVCAANVCRSPVMKFTLAAALADTGTGDGWAFDSRGTDAAPGSEVCPLAGAWLADLPGGAQAAARHRARPLTAHDLSRASIVLVASERERAVVARLRPDARAWTFTLGEAVALAAVATGRAGDPAAGPALAARGTGTTPPTGDPVRAFAELLHRHRGVAPLPRRRWVRRDAAADPRDIADVHGDGRRPHLRTARRIQSGTTALAAAMARELATVPA